MRTPEDETILNVWRKRQRLTLSELGKLLGVSGSQAGRYCLPRGHKNHDRPGRDPSEALRIASNGEVTIANYADPYLPASVPEDVQ
jgi:hypothetical protein